MACKVGLVLWVMLAAKGHHVAVVVRWKNTHIAYVFNVFSSWELYLNILTTTLFKITLSERLGGLWKIFEIEFWPQQAKGWEPLF